MKTIAKALVVFTLTSWPLIVFSGEQVSTPEPKGGNTHNYTGKVSSINCSNWESVDINKDGFVVCKCND